jgi:hypothetical protein
MGVYLAVLFSFANNGMPIDYVIRFGNAIKWAGGPTPSGRKLISVHA